MVQETYLITGAGTGFGKGIAFGLAEQGKKVIAGVETMSEVSALEKEAKEKEIELQIEKLDVTDPADRERAWTWDIDVLLNNAGISEGGSLADIPEERLRNQFEVNVFGPTLLTQKIAKEMVKKQRGKIVFMSSVSGLMADPLSGPYGGSKFALEAFAESLSKELQEFNVQVATINPGPYLTGFNDREFEAWRMWRDNPEERIFDYEQLAFPYEQLEPEDVIKESIKVLTGETNDYRNVVPKAMVPMVKKRQKELWDKKYDENLGERHELVQKSIDIEPATTPVKGIVNKIKDKL
ncbi:SDR family oxidoreductase [Desemzia sp. RIT804]|uniref:SDR family oxidoreductase n=1 Tax=Desemzia sp. RIT 804 TaxID=2810209 RepID=UPI001950E88D|nr:SDR family oxidoreductase [Desemzia sp. RIT 804]MBM6615015.1 SDR family oxidoreductase [Desemzia sp. RIT 804]